MPKRLGQEYRNKTLSTGSYLCRDIVDAVEHLLPADMVRTFRQAECLDDERYEFEEVLAPYLDSIAPEGCHFGNKPYGSDHFGFWENDA